MPNFSYFSTNVSGTGKGLEAKMEQGLPPLMMSHALKVAGEAGQHQDSQLLPDWSARVLRDTRDTCKNETFKILVWSCYILT